MFPDPDAIDPLDPASLRSAEAAMHAVQARTVELQEKADAQQERVAEIRATHAVSLARLQVANDSGELADDYRTAFKLNELTMLGLNVEIEERQLLHAQLAAVSEQIQVIASQLKILTVAVVAFLPRGQAEEGRDEYGLGIPDSFDPS